MYFRLYQRRIQNRDRKELPESLDLQSFIWEAHYGEAPPWQLHRPDMDWRVSLTMMTRSETAVTNCADRLTKKIHAILTHTHTHTEVKHHRHLSPFIVVIVPSRRKNGFKGKTFNPEPNFSYSRTRFSHRSLGGGRWVHLFSTNTSKNEACFLNRLVNHEYFCMTRELIWWINKNPVRFWWILHFFRIVTTWIWFKVWFHPQEIGLLLLVLVDEHAET